MSVPGPAAERPQGTRRTLLAAERTLLAWVRTGLAFGAVALAVGKIVPEVERQLERVGVRGDRRRLRAARRARDRLRPVRRDELDDAISEGGYAPVHRALTTIVLVGSAVLGAGDRRRHPLRLTRARSCGAGIRSRAMSDGSTDEARARLDALAREVDALEGDVRAASERLRAGIDRLRGSLDGARAARRPARATSPAPTSTARA